MCLRKVFSQKIYKFWHLTFWLDNISVGQQFMPKVKQEKNITNHNIVFASPSVLIMYETPFTIRMFFFFLGKFTLFCMYSIFLAFEHCFNRLYFEF